MNRLLRALMMLVILGSLVVAFASYALLAEIKRPVDPVVAEPVEFEIVPGDSAARIAQNLKAQDLIRQPLLFRMMVRQQEAGEKLNAGMYQLSPNMTMGEIIAALQAEQPAFEEVEFQTIEGMRMEEVAEVIVEAGLAESVEAFLEVAKDPTPFKENHARLESIPEGQSLEGYLFPNTYRVKATAAISEVIDRILSDGFDASYETFETEIIIENRSVHDIVTMASIVQREAANEEEMAHLAYIFWNRLRGENLDESGGLIGADPTVQYILGYSEEEQTWWRKELTVDDLKLDNPYNTRLKPGLPPGPISNPGLAALRAAARPGPLRPDGSEGKDDLYFVAKCGEKAHNFARTLEEFSAFEQEFTSCAE